MPPEPLIFTGDLIARASASPAARRKLIHRWAMFPGSTWRAVRRQIEAAAALVPEHQRARALGHLYSGDDRQVFAAVGVLLLAKMLIEQDWDVEHEPEVLGGTPDLRIRKRRADFFVEARHVAGDFGLPPAYQRLEAELAEIQTRTPAFFEAIRVDGGASLGGFKQFLQGALTAKATGLQTYREPGVLVSFELLSEQDRDVGVFAGYSPSEAFWFDDGPKVRAAIDEKIKKYRFPLIVALQGIETGDLFTAAEEALFGSEIVRVPINHETGAPFGKPRLARQRDSLVARQNSDGDRVRDRLEALLPFEVRVTHQGFAVRARLLGNPLKPGVGGLEEFRPIPSLLPVGDTMSYVDATGRPVEDVDSLSDEFAV